MILKFIENFYKRGYKLHLVLPAIFVLICLICVPFISLGIDLTGGTFLKIESKTTHTPDDIKSFIEQKYGLNDVYVSKNESLAGSFVEVRYITPKEQIEFQNKLNEIKNQSDLDFAKSSALELMRLYNIDYKAYEGEQLQKIIRVLDEKYNDIKNVNTNNILFGLRDQFGIDISKANVREVAPTMGREFYISAIKVSLLAAFLIVFVIFIFFREFVPSIAVIGAAIIDTLASLAGMAIFGIPLSLVTISAILMMLGYSIQTDILLTTKVLKKGEGSTPRYRAGEAMLTGLTMTLTTIAALLSMLIISYFYNVDVILSISAVLLFGMAGDVIATWFMNAPILLWYVESKSKVDKK